MTGPSAFVAARGLRRRHRRRSDDRPPRPSRRGHRVEGRLLPAQGQRPRPRPDSHLGGRGGPLMTINNGHAVVAERAATAVHDLAHLTRPAITDLTTGDLYDLTGTLTDLVAALPRCRTSSPATRPPTPHATASHTPAASPSSSAPCSTPPTRPSTRPSRTSETNPEGVNFQPRRIRGGVATLKVRVRLALTRRPPLVLPTRGSCAGDG